MLRSLSHLVILLMTSAIALPALGFAERSHERFQMNRDIHVEQNDKTGDLTCLNCSVYIRGSVSSRTTRQEISPASTALFTYEVKWLAISSL